MHMPTSKALIALAVAFAIPFLSIVWTSDGQIFNDLGSLIPATVITLPVILLRSKWTLFTIVGAGLLAFLGPIFVGPEIGLVIGLSCFPSWIVQILFLVIRWHIEDL